MSIGTRSISSASWKVTVSGFKVAIFLVRTILLARWLPVEIFGIYALANAVVRLSGILPSFGMGGAFLHRAPETEDEHLAASTHFTLKLSFVGVWMLILISGALLLTTGYQDTPEDAPVVAPLPIPGIAFGHRALRLNFGVVPFGNVNFAVLQMQIVPRHW